MLTNDDYRRILERPDMTDDEVDELRDGLRSFTAQILDEFFREEFTPDDPRPNGVEDRRHCLSDPMGQE